MTTACLNAVLMHIKESAAALFHSSMWFGDCNHGAFRVLPITEGNVIFLSLLFEYHEILNKTDFLSV